MKIENEFAQWIQSKFPLSTISKKKLVNRSWIFQENEENNTNIIQKINKITNSWFSFKEFANNTHNETKYSQNFSFQNYSINLSYNKLLANILVP